MNIYFLVFITVTVIIVLQILFLTAVTLLFYICCCCENFIVNSTNIYTACLQLRLPANRKSPFMYLIDVIGKNVLSILAS